MKFVPWIAGGALFVLIAPKAFASIDRSPYGRWGRKFVVSPRLLRKVAKVESNCRPDAVRMTGGDGARGGAYGLMQVTLATAYDLAERMPVDSDTQPGLTRFVSDPTGALLDPDVNVMFGSYYLAQLKKQLGDESYAVAAYNRGAGGVRRMLADGRDPRQLAYTQKVYAA